MKLLRSLKKTDKAAKEIVGSGHHTLMMRRDKARVLKLGAESRDET